MKKTTTITKEYNNEGILVKETTVIIEEEQEEKIVPISPPVITYHWPGPLDPSWTKPTCESGKNPNLQELATRIQSLITMSKNL